MPRIKFYTRSFDLRLYRLSSGLYRGLKDDQGNTIPCVRLTDKSADGYFYAMLRDKDCDIAINIDEDAFLTDPQALRDLLRLLTSPSGIDSGEASQPACGQPGGAEIHSLFDKQNAVKNECSRREGQAGESEESPSQPAEREAWWSRDSYIICQAQAGKNITSRRVAEAGESEPIVNIGYSDGDEATTSRDPLITNPFFNILDLRAIRSRFDRQAMKRLPQDREPYYPFFRWTATNFNTLYLPCSRHTDGMTTIGNDLQGRTICLHTWFSRFYSMPTWLVRRFEPEQGTQKQRIDAIIRQAYAMRGMQVPRFGICDNIIFAIDKTLRWLIKIPQRIANLPAKWAARRKGFSRNG